MSKISKILGSAMATAAIGMGAIALSACSVLQPPPEPLPAPASPDNDATEPATAEPEANLWASYLGDTSMPLWTVEPCEGTAPFLCISDTEGNPVGTVELQTWTLQQRPDLAEALTEAGLDPTTVNPQDPAQREAVLEALGTLVAEHYATVTQDRATTFGDTITVATDSPQEARVGSQPALLYGLRDVGTDGTVQQQTAGYMAFDGETLYVISTAAPFDEPPGFSSIEQLQAFQPYLDLVASRLQL